MLIAFLLRLLFTSIFPAAKLLRRDPRMVERKKPGLAKARKRVRIFIALFFSFTYCAYSMHGSSGNYMLRRGQCITRNVPILISYHILDFYYPHTYHSLHYTTPHFIKHEVRRSIALRGCCHSAASIDCVLQINAIINFNCTTTQ